MSPGSVSFGSGDFFFIEPLDVTLRKYDDYIIKTLET